MGLYEDGIAKASEYINGEHAAIVAELSIVRVELEDALFRISEQDIELNKSIEELLALRETIKVLEARIAELEAEQPVAHKTFYGLNLSNGTSDWTGNVKETPKNMRDRYVSTYGSFPVAKVFYSGSLPGSFNANYEGQVDGKRAYVCFKGWSPAQVIAGQADATVRSYVASVPEGWTIRLVYWQEPDDEMWVNGVFTADQYRLACDRLSDIVHGTASAGKVEMWACFMGYSIKARNSDVDRFKDTAVSKKLDGIGWDYYWNTPENSWDHASIRSVLQKQIDVTKRNGIKAWALLETGDRPHPNDPNGIGRTAFWREVYLTARELKYDDVIWFDLIGTTGDHRILPATPYGAPMVGLLKSFMGA